MDEPPWDNLGWEQEATRHTVHKEEKLNQKISLSSGTQAQIRLARKKMHVSSSLAHPYDQPD